MANRILIVEDDNVDREVLLQIVLQMGYTASVATNGKEAVQIIKNDKKKEISLILLDIIMPEMDGIETLRALQPLQYPVIVTTSSTELEHAIQSIQLGALDFITKPVNNERLMVSICNALKLNELDDKVKTIKRHENGVIKFEDLVGFDSGLSDAVNLGKKAASSDITVLITGESGVGKELFAKAIHGESARKDKPFIAVNCSAIPEKLVESILFGHEKGAFTDAVAKSAGKFREADGGTLFLDEIGELPLDVQAKLLRAIQEKEIEPVGLGKTVKVDVRVISATNREIAQRVEAKKFREDLFYRLNSFPIKLPPLRERKEDTSALAEYFISKFCALENRRKMDINPQALEKIKSYNWPGNVRELENSISRAVLMCDTDEITGEDIEFSNLKVVRNSNESISLYDEEGNFRSLEEIELEVIDYYMQKFSNKADKVADVLDVGVATIYRKRKKA